MCKVKYVVCIDTLITQIIIYLFVCEYSHIPKYIQNNTILILSDVLYLTEKRNKFKMISFVFAHFYYCNLRNKLSKLYKVRPKKNSEYSTTIIISHNDIII